MPQRPGGCVGLGCQETAGQGRRRAGRPDPGPKPKACRSERWFDCWLSWSGFSPGSSLLKSWGWGLQGPAVRTRDVTFVLQLQGIRLENQGTYRMGKLKGYLCVVICVDNGNTLGNIQER